MAVDKLDSIYDSVAKNVCARKNYKLECKNCGGDEPCSEEEFSLYLKIGWPKCCNGTMMLMECKKGGEWTIA